MWRDRNRFVCLCTHHKLAKYMSYKPNPYALEVNPFQVRIHTETHRCIIERNRKREKGKVRVRVMHPVTDSEMSTIERQKRWGRYGGCGGEEAESE